VPWKILIKIPNQKRKTPFKALKVRLSYTIIEKKPLKFLISKLFQVKV